MNKNYEHYFGKNMQYVENALKSIDSSSFEKMVDCAEKTLKNGHKIIASGLGKNVPICEKFVGSMLSMGMNAGFLHTNSAVHGDMEMIKSGDMIIILTKSGATEESVYLVDLLKKRQNVNLWLLTGQQHSVLADSTENKIVFNLEHEGDLWNILPNNSTTINLIILQTMAMELSKKMNITLDDFKPNHPGGAIGAQLKDGR